MKNAHPIRILFIITSLGTGGAEMMLFKLLSRMDRKRFSPEVISLTGNSSAANSLAARFQSLDIPLRFFNFLDLWAIPFHFISLVLHLRRRHPDLVSTWMYHADLIGGTAAYISGDTPVVWNIRHSDLKRNVDKRTTFWVAGICARLSSYVPKKIICCANSARETHASIGYDKERMVVIPNGFDLNEFRPDVKRREEIRRILGVSSNTLAIGMIGRYHPQKGYSIFVQAAKIFLSGYPRVNFILCGSGVTWENQELANLIEEAEIKKYFHLLGRRPDMPQLFAALDVVTSASVCGEGFPNVIGEAMSCAVPCVVTDVGDSAWIVGETGIVVSPGSPQQLAEAWKSIAALGDSGRHRLGGLARQRIMDNFSICKIVNKYEEFFSNRENIRD